MTTLSVFTPTQRRPKPVPASARFFEAVRPVVKNGGVSCVNCRHWVVGLMNLNGFGSPGVPVVECRMDRHNFRRIDRNVGPAVVAMAERRATACPQFDSMVED